MPTNKIQEHNDNIKANYYANIDLQATIDNAKAIFGRINKGDYQGLIDLSALDENPVEDSDYPGNGKIDLSFVGRQARLAQEKGRNINRGSLAETNKTGLGDLYPSAGIGAFKDGNKI